MSMGNPLFDYDNDKIFIPLTPSIFKSTGRTPSYRTLPNLASSGPEDYRFCSTIRDTLVTENIIK